MVFSLYNKFDVQGHTPLCIIWTQTYYTTGSTLCVILFEKLVNWCFFYKT